MAAEWFCQAKGQQFGPISPAELRRLADTGIVAPDTLVRKGADGAWVRAERVQGLFGPSGSHPGVAVVHVDENPVSRPATPIKPLRLPPAVPVHPPIVDCGRPNMSNPGDSSIRPRPPGASADDSPEKWDRIRPVTWASIIVGAGTVLLLLWALVFRDGSAPQQVAKLDQLAVANRELRAAKGVRQAGVVQGAAPEPKQFTSGDFSDRAAGVRPPAQPVAKQSVTQHRVREDELSPSELYKRISPCVVCVENYDGSDKLAAFGSGFFVSGDGRVATNLHVIQGAHKVAVRLHDGTTLALRSVNGMDQDNDLVVLEVGTRHEFIPILTRLPEVGTPVYAIGNPKGLVNTLSEGIVSGMVKDGEVQFIQTTAAISPGSSGGPLLLKDGCVVGITAASLRGGQNLNLAIPASVLRRLLDKSQQRLSLAEVNATLGGGEHRQAAIDDDPTALAVAWKAIRARRFGEALRTLEQVPSARRGCGYWIATGHVYFALENLEGARADFGTAVAIDGNNTEALLRLAVSYRLSDFGPRNEDGWNVPNALCKRVLELCPNNAQAHCILGITCAYEEEIGYLKTAATLDPKSFSAQYNLGVCLTSKRPEEAIGPLNAALELEKEADYRAVPSRFGKPLVWLSTTKSLRIGIKFALGRAYRDSEQYERAVAVYKDILTVEPDNPVALWGLCYTYRGWRKNFTHPDAVHWENRATKKDTVNDAPDAINKKRADGNAFMRDLMLDNYLPAIVDVGTFR